MLSYIILSLVTALLILSKGFREGTLWNGISYLDRGLIKNSTPPVYVDGVIFTVYNLSSLGNVLSKFITTALLIKIISFITNLQCFSRDIREVVKGLKSLIMRIYPLHFKEIISRF